MNRRTRILLLVLAGGLAGVAWLALQPRDPLFQGKPESEWIKGIAYGMSLSDDQNKEQVQRWRSLGPQGLRVLERAVNRVPPGRTYRKVYRRLSAVLPRRLMQLLPARPPLIMGGPRMKVVDLLSRMGKDAWPAWRAVARALADEDTHLRQVAICFFTSPEDDSALLNQMPARDKKEILPLFISALEQTGSDHQGLRNNAALALKYYRDQAPLIVPALTKALQDPAPAVRLLSAEALHRADPDAAKKAGAVTVLTQILRDPDDQVAHRAADALHEFQNEAEAAVPALIEALQSTNSLVACSAVWALDGAFPKQAGLIIPGLRKAAERKDDAGGYARAALKHFETKAQSRSRD